MFCIYCRAQLPDGADFCPECGRRVTSAPPPRPEPPEEFRFMPAPPPKPKPKSRVPFVLLLAVCFLWFLWRTFGLQFLVFQMALRSLPPEHAATYRAIAQPRLLEAIIALDLPHLAALAGLIAVLVLVSREKIDPRAFGWGDVVPMAVLCAAMPPALLLSGYSMDLYYGQSVSVGFSAFWQVIRGPVPTALAALGLWAACIAFLLIRSGKLRVTRKMALLCLGVLIGVSLLLTAYCSAAVRDYVELAYSPMPYDDRANIEAYAQMMTQAYCPLLWVKWAVLFWFASDSGGRLPVGGRLAFAGVVVVGLWLGCDFLASLQLGPHGGILAVPAAFLLGGAVLLAFRLAHRSRAL